MSLNFPLIPDQAFLYFPKQQEVVQSKNGKHHRVFFDGDLDYSKEEKIKIKQLKDQMAKKQKNSNLKVFESNVLLRFLQATQFNNTNCIKALREFKLWQQNNLPIKLTPQIQKLLKEGILYVSGRDCCYRPILVVNVGKILQISPKEKLFLQTLGYFFQFVIQNLLIQGQIQNWVSIIDLGNASVFSLGGTLVDTITYLSSTFRSRVHHSYLVNAPSSIKFVWGMVKGAMNQDQLRKLSLSGKKQLNQEDFIQINKSQVEKKYGGQKQNVYQFWPIQPYEQNFQTEKSRQIILISKQEYNKRYQNKELRNRKINTKYIHQGHHLGLFGSQSSLSRRMREQKLPTISNSSCNNDVTRSQIEEDFGELNSKIPKQRQPPQVPIIPESYSFGDFLNSLVNKIFY